MLDEDKLHQLRGAKLIAGSEEVGEIDEVYAHSSDNLPAVVAVNAGGERVLVPLPPADMELGDRRVTVPFAADAISGAPQASGDTLAADEFDKVYAHFGIDDSDMREDTGLGRTGRASQGMSRDPRSSDAPDDASQGHP
jgi:PRC-barrel domain